MKMNIERIARNIFYGTAIAAAIALPAELIYDRHVKAHLEPGAIYLGFFRGPMRMTAFNLPIIKNKDVDGNGLYESVIVYKDGNKNKLYQEMKRKENGEFIFESPNPYR